jgi:5'-3' exonuclease
MSKLGLIDGNSVGYASNYAMKLTSGDQETQAVFGFLRTLREVAVTYPDYGLITLWDGRATWRFDIYPDYKSNREADAKKVAFKDSYVSQRPYIQRCLQHLGVRQITAMTHEADDMGGLLVSNLSKVPGSKITVFTGDQDWLQFVKENVSWRDLRDDSRQINAKNFQEKTGYANPMAFLEGKCLMGDTSDVIPGVGGVGEKRAKELLAEFGSVRTFWKKVEAGEHVPRLAWQKNLATKEAKAAFLRNLKLMQLMKVPKPNREDIRDIRGGFDKEAFANVCEELAFTSILRTLDKFVEPFQPKH